MSRRLSGKGHVYRRGRIWWISLWVAGRRHRETSGSEHRGDAVRLLADRVAMLAPSPGHSSTTLADLAGVITTDYQMNRRDSLERMRICLAHLTAFFRADCPARAITESRLVEYSGARLRDGAGPGTINLELGTLRHSFRLALDLGRVAKVPRFRLLRPPAPRQGFVEREHLESIMAHLPPHLRPPVLAAWLTGWRISSEILTRRWRHVDIAGGWLRLDPGEGKTGEGREFPLTAELKSLLVTMRAFAADVGPGLHGRLVFSGQTGAPIRCFRRAWRKAVSAAGLPDLRPHDLRRSAVRNLERAGVPRTTAMRLVGHRTQAIYDRYAIVDARALHEAALKIDAQHQESPR